jgi:hypothetical protein
MTSVTLIYVGDAVQNFPVWGRLLTT